MRHTACSLWDLFKTFVVWQPDCRGWEDNWATQLVDRHMGMQPLHKCWAGTCACTQSLHECWSSMCMDTALVQAVGRQMHVQVPTCPLLVQGELCLCVLWLNYE